MKKMLVFLGVAALVVMAGGCASTPDVSYGSPDQVETVSVDFGSTDLQMIAEKMVNSLLASPILSSGKKPVFYVQTVRNKTDEHLDTKAVTDKIRVTLLKSGKVRFTAVAEVKDELMGQLEFQASSGMVDPATAKSIGKLVGADYFLYGELTSIRKSAGRVKDVYYKFTLNLVNIQNGLIEWADEKEIRKQAKKPLLGG
ncbi:MAG TPA: penicillin-binding protein activator LpoB [Deltaproteobacteria bacterium]|nr:penicillin-binding protein activator LpoB [Deltaproteobacteria bacterium]HPR54263.1 penicillin-binding protein activator LpoB [Deltaproteobacteria bacterium]HXK45825.1 penicillin-binding protein activator LpoB [Deltaproteobacteria bacterium]